MQDQTASYSPRTDLALESREALLAERPEAPIPGVTVDEESIKGIKVTRVHITSSQGAQLMGKPEGTYVTLEAGNLRQRDKEHQQVVSEVLAGELTHIWNLPETAEVLVVGLGNWRATPDALGPQVVEHLLVTRHLRDFVPADVKGGLRGVAALAPGVLGITGIETGDIIRGVVDRIHPDAVVVIDALAARSSERIATTIQIADTGIHPGSGVGNHRASLTRESLGVPVYAIGTPTVVHALTIAYDALDALARKLKDESSILDAVHRLETQEVRSLVQEVLPPNVGDLMVTPKEIDSLIKDLSHVVAGALNAALHPAISPEEMALYLE